MKSHRFSLLPVLTTATLLATSLAAFAQEEAAPAVEGMSVLDTILHGGPLIMFIWICILGTSMAMVTIIIKLFIVLRNESLVPRALLSSLRDTIASGNYQEAWEICRANRAYVALVMRGTLEKIGRGKETCENALAENASREGQILKTPNSYLSVIGVIAPMIGLLGTVIGMMGAFSVLGQSGVSDPRQLAMRIGEVLMATASGLFIAIPAFVFYYFFRNKTNIALVIADGKCHSLIAELPYEEIAGLDIGENFGGVTGGNTVGASTSHRVSKDLATNCPVCNNPITAGQNPCPHCQATLDWN